MCAAERDAGVIEPAESLTDTTLRPTNSGRPAAEPILLGLLLPMVLRSTGGIAVSITAADSKVCIRSFPSAGGGGERSEDCAWVDASFTLSRRGAGTTAS